MRLSILLALAALLIGGTVEAAARPGGWRLLTAKSPAAVEAVLRLGNGVYLDLGEEGDDGARYHRVHLENGAAVLEALPNFLVAPMERRPDMLPDGLLARHGRGLREAWLSGPTQRYRHGALGDGFEATTLNVTDDLGRQLHVVLPPDSVFEDRYPRFADLDGDGVDEAVVVRSYLARGSALAVFKLEGEALRLVAETEPIGQPNRWLNPVGIGDLDGDGRVEVAAVLTPHAGGALAIYELAEEGLRLKARAEDFSNHAIGMRELAMSALADLDGDGDGDLAVPDGSLRRLRLMSFAGGRLTELASIPHEQPIASAIHAIDLNGDGRREVVYALEDGTVAVVERW